MNPLKFNLDINVVPVTFDGPDGSVEMELHEMTAVGRDRYLDSLQARMKLDAAGQVYGVKKFEGLQTDLLIRCLRRKDGKALTEAEVQAWPASVVADIFKAAQEMNRLDRQDGENASKNA
jgi:hypothetical protein